MLHTAARCTQPEGGRLLVAAGADATAKDGYGLTALHCAAYSGPDDPSLAGVLLGAGCDPAAKSTSGKTALDIAKARNKPRMAALLEAVAAWTDAEATLAPYRAEVFAMRQLIAERGMEKGLTAIVSEPPLLAAIIAETLGRADKALPGGTRISVAGRGRGSYVRFLGRWVGANEHTIAFDSPLLGGQAAIVHLKTARWAVTEAGMAAIDELHATAAAARASPRWVPDAQFRCCMVCEAEFSAANRRHHCRRCGWVICATCSPEQLELDRIYVHDPSRKDEWLDERQVLAQLSGGGGAVITPTMSRVCALCCAHLKGQGPLPEPEPELEPEPEPEAASSDDSCGAHHVTPA